MVTDQSVRMLKSEDDQITLKDCVDAFVKEEKLGEDNKWYCPKCKEFTQATKKLDLYSLPPILVIHLKRFQYNSYHRDKLDTLVQFPLHDLVLDSHVISDNHKHSYYDLFAVSVRSLILLFIFII